MQPRIAHEHEDQVLSELCLYLSPREKHGVRVLCRPDRFPGRLRRCDAILQRGPKQVAVEHTRIHSSPQHPKVARILDQISPAIRDLITAAYPHSWVRLGIPVEEFVSGRDWKKFCVELANRCSSALAGARVSDRVTVSVPGFRVDAFAERYRDDAPEGLCWVSPVIWGRDPSELTVDDICRALADKRGSVDPYRQARMSTLLVLEAEGFLDFMHLPDRFARALERESAVDYDEVYLAVDGYSPRFILPLKLGERTSIGQPELGEFIGLRQEVERRAKRAASASRLGVGR